ncbi:hypothetical protein [Sporosarcina sp. P33]|uniref:hypothetical protein n=1 Tax=Sporosarcina sp. P33 TaxID=1930764 RepID=UPI0012DD7F2D|nr:hypothetical protein [Sporosarcina sp. P33]
MTKSYADTPEHDQDRSSSKIANDAAKAAEEQVEEIKKEARREVQNKNGKE